MLQRPLDKLTNAGVSWNEPVNLSKIQLCELSDYFSGATPLLEAAHCRSQMQEQQAFESQIALIALFDSDVSVQGRLWATLFKLVSVQIEIKPGFGIFVLKFPSFLGGVLL